MRYGCNPVFSKPCQQENSSLVGNIDDTSNHHSKHDARSTRKHPSKQHKSRPSALPPLNSSPQPPRKRSYREESKEEEKCINIGMMAEGVTGFSINSSPSKAKYVPTKNDTNQAAVLKPLPNFGGDVELRSLALSIKQDILQTTPDVTWDDIVGLNGAYLHVFCASILHRNTLTMLVMRRSQTIVERGYNIAKKVP
jgi:hypothetical protein